MAIMTEAGTNLAKIESWQVPKLNWTMMSYLDDIAAGSRGKISTEEILARIAEGRYHLWVAYTEHTTLAASLVEIEYWPKNYAVLHIIGGAGKNKDIWATREVVSIIERWGRNTYGCSSVKVTGRLGWKRVFEAMGYAATHIVLEKDIEP